MSSDKQLCDLCGLPVKTSGFELNTKEGVKRFCCEGCLSIYEMLNEDNLLLEESDGESSKP
ncbi:MAG: heavy metal translocating P-type ATPase metal-binding domain-containing protein [Gammaproteobacteria bacterium]